MDPLPTLDLLMSDPETGKDRLTLAVQAAIAAALGELAAVEAFDRAAGALSSAWFDRPVGTTIRALYEGWVPAAEALHARVAAAVARAGPMVAADKLEYAIGKTQARLSITLDDMEAAVSDGPGGREIQFASVEEMRRELLRPNVSQPGPGSVQAAEPARAGAGA